MCQYFNPRSLAGATNLAKEVRKGQNISIHAPSRERLSFLFFFTAHTKISIHAPSRERLSRLKKARRVLEFQSTLPRGSDGAGDGYRYAQAISIHAPSRERPCLDSAVFHAGAFQSTLPRGSDAYSNALSCRIINFNPRSLAGATTSSLTPAGK